MNYNWKSREVGGAQVGIPELMTLVMEDELQEKADI